MIPRIEKEKWAAHYDSNKQIACVVAFKQISLTDILTDVYQWIAELLEDNLDVHAILMDIGHLRTFQDSSNGNNFNPSSAELATSTSIPLILITQNSYQERKLDEYLQTIPQIPNKQIAQGYIAAFDSIDKLHKLDEIDLNQYRLSTKQVSLWVSIESGSVHVIYYGVVTAQATADVYGRLMEIGETVDVKSIKAAIYDFRYVHKFDNSNLRTVNRSSSTLNKQHDMSHIAVALVVGNLHQEQMVRLAMKVSPQEERKKIVFGLDAANQFLGDFMNTLQEKQEQG